MTITKVIPPVSLWREELKHRYISLFGRAARDIGAPQLWTLPDGWQEVAERLCLRLALIMSASTDGWLTIERIRNKDAIMDVRWISANLDDLTTYRVNLVIALATARSGRTCEQCGEEGRHYRSAGFNMTACDQHRIGDAVEIDPPWHQYDIFRDGRNGRVVNLSSRRYDRAYDCFVDADDGDA